MTSEKDEPKLDLSVLAVSSRGKSGDGARIGSSEFSRVGHRAQARKKRERWKKGKAERKARLLSMPGRNSWNNRRPRPWRVQDRVLMAFVPGEAMTIQRLGEIAGMTKQAVAPMLHQHLIPKGFVEAERVRTISAADRARGVKGHEIEFWLTVDGREEQKKLQAERDALELEQMMA